MFDGQDPGLFNHFAAVAQRLGVYTVKDYTQIVEHLVKVWNVAGRSVSGRAARAQQFLCKNDAVMSDKETVLGTWKFVSVLDQGQEQP